MGYPHGFVRGFARKYLLTPREMETLSLTVGGASTKEVASLMGCSPNTVQAYWFRIFGKTGVRSQAFVLALLIRELEISTGHADEAAAPAVVRRSRHMIA